MRVHGSDNGLQFRLADGASKAMTINTRKAVGYDERRSRARSAEDNESVAADWRSDIRVAKIPFINRIVKRTLDVTLSAVGLLAISPILAVIAIGVKLTSRGPVLYTHDRVGVGGRLFTCYKFRTMIVNAEEMKAALADVNQMDGPVFKLKHDPRITGPFGRFLRKASLDELPQLVNVLLGDMSLVGPRPPLEKEVVEYKKWQIRRLSVTPGITCTWQVSGRNEIAFDDWMRLDLDYIDNWSLTKDVTLLFKTVGAVVTARGAC